MYQNVNTPCNLGQTYYGGNVPALAQWKETVDIEGMTAEFEDLAPATTRGGVRQKRSGMPKKCRLVRNVTAGETVLLPKMLVRYASGYRFQRVTSNVCVADEEAAGVVDECLPAAGVKYGDLFWITVDGQTLVKGHLDGTAIAAGDKLLAATAATTNATTSGRVKSFVLTSDTTTMSPRDRNIVGFAISAATGGETNKDILCHIQLA